MLYLVDKVIHTGTLTQIGQESENLEFDNQDHCSEDALRDESYDNNANNKDDNNDVNNGHDDGGDTNVCADLT